MGIESGEVAVADEGIGREGDDVRAHVVGFFGGDAEEVVTAEDLLDEGDIALMEEALTIDECAATAHGLEGAVEVEDGLSGLAVVLA